MFEHIENLKNSIEKCGYKTSIVTFSPSWINKNYPKTAIILTVYGIGEDGETEFRFNAKTGEPIF